MILAVINAIYSTAQKNLKNEHFSPKVFLFVLFVAFSQ